MDRFRREKAAIRRLLNRISQGEGMHLDFKYHIDDAARIARSLCAFANSEGGSLLVGVKDNGRIVGVETSEELYVVESANDRHLRPSLSLRFEEWKYRDKVVLEVHVPKAQRKPVFVLDTDRKWRAYFRDGNQNVRAPLPWVKGMLQRYGKRKLRFSYTSSLRQLILFFQRNAEPATLAHIQHLTRLPFPTLLNDLATLVAFDLLAIDFDQMKYRYRMREDTMHVVWKKEK